MYDTLPTSYYVTRVIPVPPGRARAAFGSPDGVRTARLRPSFTRSFTVELEVVPWSSTRTQLGLRFCGRRRPNLRDLEAAGTLLDGLAAEIELRCLLAEHPAHGVAEPAVSTPERERAVSAWL